MRKRIGRILLILVLLLPVCLSITAGEACAQSFGDAFASQPVDIPGSTVYDSELSYTICSTCGKHHPNAANWHGESLTSAKAPQILGDLGAQVNIGTNCSESIGLDALTVERLEAALIQQCNIMISLICFLSALIAVWKLKKANRHNPVRTSSVLVMVAAAIAGYFWWY